MRARRLTPDRATRGVFAVLVASALVLAACGDDDGNGRSGAGPGDIEIPGGVDFPTNECIDAFSALIGASLGAFAPGTDFGDSVDALDRVAENAPSAVRDDFEVLVGAFEEFQRELDESGVDLSDPSSFTDPEAQEALEGLGDVFDDPEVAAASENVEAYLEEVCPQFADPEAP